MYLHTCECTYAIMCTYVHMQCMCVWTRWCVYAYVHLYYLFACSYVHAHWTGCLTVSVCHATPIIIAINVNRHSDQFGFVTVFLQSSRNDVLNFSYVLHNI